MAIVSCDNNHFYDDERDSSCPYCAKLQSGERPESEMSERFTSYFDLNYEEDDDTAQMTEAYGDDVKDYEKTIGIFLGESRNELTVGWLVGVRGPVRGISYSLHSGRNFVGRSYDMDVSIMEDLELSREKHFSVVYEPKSIAFFLVAGSGRTYLNGKLVTDAVAMTEADEIEAGGGKFLFIPFCKEGRTWDAVNGKNE